MKPLFLVAAFLAARPLPGAAQDGTLEPGPAQAQHEQAASAPTLDGENKSRFRSFLNSQLKDSGMTESQITAAAAGHPIEVPASLALAVPTRPSGADFDRFFKPAGSFEAAAAVFKKCRFADGCDRLAAFAFKDGAVKYVELQLDAEKGPLKPESPEYQDRHGKIKSGMERAMDQIYPKDGRKTDFQTELNKAAHPVVSAIFSEKELLKYAERNASQTGSAPSYAYLGDIWRGSGQNGKARDAYDKALAKDPANAQALSGRARANFDAGDFPAAARDAQGALAVNPNDKNAQSTYMLSVDRMPGGQGGDKGVAAQAPAAAAGAGTAPGGSVARGAGALSNPDPLASAALTGRGKDLLSKNDPAGAAALLKQAVALNAGNGQAFSFLSMAENRQGKYKDALASAEAGLKLAPKSAALLNSKAFALNRMRDYKGALAAADYALSVNPRDPVAYFNRAAALQGLGQKDEMIEALRHAAELDPRYAAVLDAALKDADEELLLPGETRREKPSQPLPATRGGPSWTMLAGGAGAGALLALFLAASSRRKKEDEDAPPPARQAPGLLGGNFEVGREIGVGGMGVVYEGRDRSLDRPVAVKRMREEIRWDQKERERFVSEAKFVAKLQHPNVVSILAIVEEAGEVCLIFEYIAGQTLNDLIGAQGKLTLQKARDIFRGVASALDYAHGRGVIHRDLKPANVMIDAHGLARVMDFGIARLAEEAVTRHTSTQTFVGTPLYMAPEQEQSVARKESDVYAMALCLYEALTGRPPFAGTGAGLLLNKLNKAYPAASSLVPGLPKGIDEVFARAFEPSPEKRFPAAGELLRALEALEASARVL